MSDDQLLQQALKGKAATSGSIGALISGSAAKATPVDADSLGLSDSAAGGILKKLTWANVKAALLSYFATAAVRFQSIGVGTAPAYLVDVEKDALGYYSNFSTGVTQTAINLENKTPATALAKNQDTPTLRFGGQYWDGSVSQPLLGAISFGDDGSGTNAQFSVWLKRGTAAAKRIIILDAFGQFASPVRYAAYNARQTSVMGRSLGNDAAATVSYNQRTAFDTSYSPGWKTGGTPGSQYMSIGSFHDPETGSTNPVGVFKWFYGTNTPTPSVTNELMRLEWGDRLGVVFNSKAIAGYNFQFVGVKVFANNAAALTGGLTAGMAYRTGADPDPICIVH